MYADVDGGDVSTAAGRDAPREGHPLAQPQRSLSPRPLDGSRLHDVVKAIAPFQQEIAPVAELVRQPGADDATLEDHPRLDPCDHDREMWVRKPRPVTGTALGDVRHSLRVTERGFQRRREPPPVAADRLGKAEPLQEGEPAPFLKTVLPLAPLLGHQRAGGDDPFGAGPAEERPG